MLLPFLPINNITNIVLDYAPQTDEQLEQASHNLLNATNRNQVPEVVAALNDGADTEAFDTSNGDIFKTTALQHSALSGYIEIVQILLNNNAHVNTTQGFLQQSPLHEASTGLQKNSPAIVKMLLDHTANIDMQDEDKDTPLLIAICHTSQDIARILMKAGANADIKDDFDRTAWQRAEDNPEMLQAMREGQQELARELSAMLLQSDVLKQHVIVPGIVRLINDYTAL